MQEIRGAVLAYELRKAIHDVLSKGIWEYPRVVEVQTVSEFCSSCDNEGRDSWGNLCKHCKVEVKEDRVSFAKSDIDKILAML